MPTGWADGGSTTLSGVHPARTRALDVILLLCRLAVGGVWIAAGALKLPDPAESVRAVRNYRILPEAVVGIVGYGLPVFEIAVGLLLVVGVATRTAAVTSTALLVVFIAGITAAWARGLDIDCGCFGGGGGTDAGAAAYGWDIARDVALLVASVLIALRGPGVLLADSTGRAVVSSSEENR